MDPAKGDKRKEWSIRDDPKLCTPLRWSMVLVLVLMFSTMFWLGSAIPIIEAVAVGCSYMCVFLLLQELQGFLTHTAPAINYNIPRDAYPRTFKWWLIINGFLVALAGLTAIGCWLYLAFG